MAQVELIMPKMGESVAEATVIKWLKNVGETIEIDESVLEIATDKVDSEVPSSVEGVLVKQLFNEDDVVLVGQAVAIIETEASSAEVPAPKENHTEAPKEVAVAEEMVEKAMECTSLPKSSNSTKFFSPLVRSIAQEEGIDIAELETVSGSGKDGRVTKKDILAYLSNRTSAPAKVASPKAVDSLPSCVAPAAPLLSTFIPVPSSN